MKKLFSKYSLLFISLILVVITLAVYSRVLTLGFSSYDDQDYVVNNRHIHNGFNGESLAWAMAGQRANWHPLTWMSGMLDWQLYGARPMGAPSNQSACFTSRMSVLLFLVLGNLMTRQTGKSAFVAALFAVHPLHVESVAWVAERKDVLSALFWMLTLIAYARYARRPLTARRPGWGYFCVALTLAARLTAKPMLVSLPIVLLLMDYWPLTRTQIVERRPKQPQPYPLAVWSARRCGCSRWSRCRAWSHSGAALRRSSAGAGGLLAARPHRQRPCILLGLSAKHCLSAKPLRVLSVSGQLAFLEAHRRRGGARGRDVSRGQASPPPPVP